MCSPLKSRSSNVAALLPVHGGTPVPVPAGRGYWLAIHRLGNGGHAAASGSSTHPIGTALRSYTGFHFAGEQRPKAASGGADLTRHRRPAARERRGENRENRPPAH